MQLCDLGQECPVDQVEGDEEQGEDDPGIPLNITGLEGEEEGGLGSVCDEAGESMQELKPLLYLNAFFIYPTICIVINLYWAVLIMESIILILNLYQLIPTLHLPSKLMSHLINLVKVKTVRNKTVMKITFLWNSLNFLWLSLILFPA